jgi:hypothetical protein
LPKQTFSFDTPRIKILQKGHLVILSRTAAAAKQVNGTIFFLSKVKWSIPPKY